MATIWLALTKGNNFDITITDCATARIEENQCPSISTPGVIAEALNPEYLLAGAAFTYSRLTFEGAVEI